MTDQLAVGYEGAEPFPGGGARRAPSKAGSG